MQLRCRDYFAPLEHEPNRFTAAEEGAFQIDVHDATGRRGGP
ncbi:hypothetical protein FHT78_005936 [Rhizobium sp. BK196]|nr:hypothetical protein [Rhizobium sp. BK196]